MAEEIGIVLSVEERGERFWLLDFIGPVSGLMHPLLRKSRRVSRPDLFDTARISYRDSNKGKTIFIEDYTPLQRRTGIGKDYRRIQTASRLANFLRKNSYHLESHDSLLHRMEQFFQAVEKGIAIEAALFKTLYLFVKDEGYAVREDWWYRLPIPEQTTVQSILKEPLSEQSTTPESVHRMVEDLFQWLEGYADFTR